MFSQCVRKTQLKCRAFVYDAAIEIDHDRIASFQSCYVPIEDDTVCFLLGKSLLDEARHEVAVSLR